MKNKNMRTGARGHYCVCGHRGRWRVETPDNNGVWVDVDPGCVYTTRAAAEADAAEYRRKWRDAEWLREVRQAREEEEAAEHQYRPWEQ